MLIIFYQTHSFWMESLNHNLLLKQLSESSIKAFGMIYELYSNRLLKYLMWATPSKEDAEEIVHDILVALWEMRKSIKPDANLDSLIYSIAYRKRIDAIRRIVKAPIFEDYFEYCGTMSSETQNTIEYKEFLVLFKMALQRLPLQQQKIIILSRLKGYDNKEIALKLRLSEKTIRNNLSSGLKQLHSEWGKIKS